VSADRVPEYGDLGDTPALREPSPREIPGKVLGLAIAMRDHARESAQRHEAARAREAELEKRIGELETLVRSAVRWVLGTVAAGSITVAGTCIGVGMYVGGRVSMLDATIAGVTRNDERITHLERLVMEKGRDE